MFYQVQWVRYRLKCVDMENQTESVWILELFYTGSSRQLLILFLLLYSHVCYVWFRTSDYIMSLFTYCNASIIHSYRCSPQSHQYRGQYHTFGIKMAEQNGDGLLALSLSLSLSLSLGQWPLSSVSVSLSSLFCEIYNHSLSQCKVPISFKTSTIINVPPKPNLSSLKDYRPVEHSYIHCHQGVWTLGAALPEDSYRLYTRPTSVRIQSKQVSGRRSIRPRLHHVLKHLDRLNTYARILFIDNSLVFNTIIQHKRFSKLRLRNVNSQMCRWILDFLPNWTQVVKFNCKLSEPLTLSTGAPQGGVLSPRLFRIFTNDCRFSSSSTLIFKFSDNTTIGGLITNADESAYREEVEQVVDWCTNNDLQLNEANTKEMITDFEEE